MIGPDQSTNTGDYSPHPAPCLATSRPTIIKAAEAHSPGHPAAKYRAAGLQHSVASQSPVRAVQASRMPSAIRRCSLAMDRSSRFSVRPPMATAPKRLPRK